MLLESFLKSLRLWLNSYQLPSCFEALKAETKDELTDDKEAKLEALNAKAEAGSNEKTYSKAYVKQAAGRVFGPHTGLDRGTRRRSG